MLCLKIVPQAVCQHGFSLSWAPCLFADVSDMLEGFCCDEVESFLNNIDYGGLLLISRCRCSVRWTLWFLLDCICALDLGKGYRVVCLFLWVFIGFSNHYGVLPTIVTLAFWTTFSCCDLSDEKVCGGEELYVSEFSHAKGRCGMLLGNDSWNCCSQKLLMCAPVDTHYCSCRGLGFISLHFHISFVSLTRRGLAAHAAWLWTGGSQPLLQLAVYRSKPVDAPNIHVG